MKVLFALYASLFTVRLGEAAALTSFTWRLVGEPTFTLAVAFLFVFAALFPEVSSSRRALQFCVLVQESLLLPMFVGYAIGVAGSATNIPQTWRGAALLGLIVLFLAVQFALNQCAMHLRAA